MTTQPTALDTYLLRTAARHADGRVIQAGNLRGGARVKVLATLLRRGLD